MMESKLLDCTLRDGGYYNNWDFEKERIEGYVAAMHKLGISWIELGFRSRNKNGFNGACAYTADEYISSLLIEKSINYGVMVNATELLQNGAFSRSAFDELFPNDSSKTCIYFVRIAFYAKDFSEAIKASYLLKDKGFFVIFNLMQAGSMASDDISAIALQASQAPIDVLYFADSMGGMESKDIKRVINSIRMTWRGEIGIHAHNNMGLALQNTLTAMDLGCEWLDCTVAGLGRGAGNAKTEILAIELSEKFKKNIELLPTIEIIKEYFGPLREISREYESIYYYLSGKYGVHPTYIQEMMTDSRYSVGDMLAVIKKLRIDKSNSYSSVNLFRARNMYVSDESGKWSPKDQFVGKNILLLGSGRGVEKHKLAIETYIKKHNPIVMSLNSQNIIDKSLIDYAVVCHPLKLLTEIEKLADAGCNIISPVSSFDEEHKRDYGETRFFDYGLKVNFDCKEAVYGNKACIISSPIAAAYAMAIATVGSAKCLFLAGFDGYDNDDLRQIDMERAIGLHQNIENCVPLVAVTPTKYSINVKSIYGLIE